MFDQLGRGGLIQARLRHVHKSLNKDKPKVQRKRGTPKTDDSSPKRAAVGSDVTENSAEYLVLIQKLSGLCPKTAENEIKQWMTETLPHRSALTLSNQLNILNTYNKFTDCNYLVSKYLVG